MAYIPTPQKTPAQLQLEAQQRLAQGKQTLSSIGNWLGNAGKQTTPIATKAPVVNTPQKVDWSSYNPAGSIQNLLGVKAASPTQNVSTTSNATLPNAMKATQNVSTPVVSPAPTDQVQSTPSTPPVDYNKQLEAMKGTLQGLSATLASQQAESNQPTSMPGTMQGGTYSPYKGGTDLYGQLTTNLANLQDPTNPLNQAVNSANQKLQQLNTEYAQQTANIEGTPGSLAQSQGQQGVLQRLFAAKQGAIQDELQNALTARSQAVGALQSAAGLAQPQITTPGQVPFYPTTGTTGGMVGASGATGGLDVNNIADQVVAGKMSLEQANGSLNNNIGLTSALRSAISQKSPGFNFAQASALGGTQGVVAPQLQMAQKAIENLNNTFNSLPGWQKMSIPLLNTLGNMFSQVTSVGLGGETAKQNAIKEARTQVANALGTATNTTPTSWDSTVQSWFPENATPEQLSAGIEQFNNLAKSRQTVYGTPGQVGAYGSSGTTGGTDPYSAQNFWQ